ncbi:MAG: glycerophosphodiester phosphodiesterase family protein [Lentisphaerota bacterium]
MKAKASSMFIFMVLCICSTIYAKTPTDGFFAVAHRGGRDIRPENTIPAFAYGMETGVTSIELDVYLSIDGVVVVSHDPFLSYTLARNSEGEWLPKDKPLDIRLMKYADIEKYLVGETNPADTEYFALHGTTQVRFSNARIPTLAEVFELMNLYKADNVLMNLEIKTCPDPKGSEYTNSPDPELIAKKVLAVIDQYKMRNRIRILEFDWRVIKKLKEIAPDLTLVALIEPDGTKADSPWLGGLKLADYNNDPVMAAKAIGADIYSPEFHMLTKEIVIKAHSEGLRVEPWTANEVADMMNLIDIGVDGITTDRPLTLREVMFYKGLKLPAPVKLPVGVPDWANDPSLYK